MQKRVRHGRIWSWLGLGVATALVAGVVLSVSLSFASASPATSFVLTLPAGATAGVPFSATITAVKSTGAVDSAYKGAKTLSWSGPGTAPDNIHAPAYPANPVTFTSGVATVSITLFKAETTAVQVADGSINGSASLTVAAAAPATLTFTQQPTETQVSSPINESTSPVGVRVQAKDAFANLADNTSVAIAIGSNPGSGALSGTTTQPTDSSGVATFTTLSIDHVGVVDVGYTLVATAPPAGPATATSVAFIVAQTVNRGCGSTCSARATIDANSTVDVSANGTVSGNTLGIALIGAVSPPVVVCPGFKKAPGAPGSYVNVTSTSVNSQPTLRIVWQLDRSIVNLLAENGASHYELCLGSVNLLHASDPTFMSGWTTEDGSPAVRVYDPIFGVYVFWGLLPGCPKKGPLSGPCRVSTSKTGSGDLLYTYDVAYPWDPSGWLG
jgi:hypothetical protein